ncbi:hypothetical protein BH10ACI1_BH10ACI1_15520 [soil metagenome]
MKRQISSKQTFFLRIILPILFVVIISAATVSMYLQPDKSGKSAVFLLPGIFVVVLPIIILILSRFKAVSVDDKFLYVSNYLKEIAVPLSDIRDVTESRLRGHPVTIHLKTRLEFGEKITFLPKIRPFTFSKSHPIVAELKELANIKI